MKECPNPIIDNLEAVIFDLDGTLIDTVDLIRETFRHTTRTLLGREIPDEELMAGVGCPLIVQMAGFDAERAQELTDFYRTYQVGIHDDYVREYPGVDEVLADLHGRGLPMAIVTSKSHDVARKGLELFDLNKYFPTLIGFDDVEIHKPDPYPLHVAAERLGVDITRSIYLGDSPFDMEAAISGGAISVAARWGAFDNGSVLRPRPLFAIDAMTDLIDLIDCDAEKYRVNGEPYTL